MSKVSVTCVEEGIFQLKLNDVENQNRLSDELVDDVLAALALLRVEATLKVLILAGREQIFCAGATLEALYQLSQGKKEAKELSLPNELLSFPVPVIGALQGAAVGGGLTLALCCDMLVAAESRRYGVNFTNMGFTPGLGTTKLLPALVGHHFASEMMLSGKLYKGRELKGRGLFNYIAKADTVMPVALDLARRIAEKPRYVIEMLKETLSLARRQALAEATSREHLMHEICFAHPETIALIEATYIG